MYLNPSKFDFVACIMSIDRVRQKFIVDTGENANCLPIKMKIAMNEYPDSQFSMKVVFGFEICKVKNINIKVPTNSLITSLIIVEASSFSGAKGPSVIPFINYETINPKRHPTNRQPKYNPNKEQLYLFSFRRAFERVIAGLKFAPHKGAQITMETSKQTKV